MRNEQEELKIRISGLSNGVHEYHFTASPAALGLHDAFRTPVSLVAELEKNTRQIYLKTRIAAGGLFVCDRCLDEFEREISSRLNLIFVFGESDAQMFEGDDVRIIQPETPAIDITDDVRQSIMLAVPLKLLCVDECSGLCPHCGTNWNKESCTCRDNKETDTRWESLKKIL